MKTLATIARTTFKETIRDKVLYSLLVFAVLAISASLLAGSVSLGQDIRVIQDFGLTAILVFLLVITIFIGTQTVYREVEQKTIYLTLSKPVGREVFYLGKFLGIALTVAVSGIIMGALLLGVLWFKSHIFFTPVVWATVFIVMEAWLLIAVGLLFSAFTSPLSSAVYTFGLALIGHSATTIWTIAQNSSSFLKYVLQFVYYAFPNLEKFNLRNEVIYNFQPDAAQIVTIIIYFLAYTGALLLLGMSIFRRDEF
jgi:ABC-type transport system involved in multi-copper enzyme maturation permease subunit